MYLQLHKILLVKSLGVWLYCEAMIQNSSLPMFHTCILIGYFCVTTSPYRCTKESYYRILLALDMFSSEKNKCLKET